MYRSHLRRSSYALCRTQKLFSSQLAAKKSLHKVYLEKLRKNIKHIPFLGPTAEEILEDVDLSNKTCLITGANSGIGLEMTRCLSNNNCTVIMACRNCYATDIATRNVGANMNNLKLYKINLASLASVKQCSMEIIKEQPKLDIVILNAGVFGLPWTLTEDLLETTFQVNFLSHQYLIMNLESHLSPTARVVLMASESHRYIHWPSDMFLTPTKDMLSLPKHDYTSIKAYNVSKLCNILFMHYLAYRWMNSGKSVFAVHPGSFVNTKLSRNWWVYEMLYLSMIPFAKSISQAAATPLYCATSPKLDGLTDQYYKNLQQCHESDLGKNLTLAYRTIEVTKEILSEHVAISEKVHTLEQKQADEIAVPPKETIDENILVANYTA